MPLASPPPLSLRSPFILPPPSSFHSHALRRLSLLPSSARPCVALRPPETARRRLFPLAFCPTPEPLSHERWDGNHAGFSVRRGTDIATLGNLCVDIVLSVPELPPRDRTQRKSYMDRLAASPPHQKYWEGGGNCNLTIAASRLGLYCAALGHVGDEIYGHFLQSVLQEENVCMVPINEDSEACLLHSAEYETLLCWVLVDPQQNHGFCSRADFSNVPAFSWVTRLSRQAEMAIRQSKILFCNGYAFDELVPSVIVSALDCAISYGTAIFFDPGPRVRNLSSGDPDQQRALERFLQLSDVLLFTSEEAEILTGIQNPVKAGRELIRKGTRTRWVIIKMGSKGSILITNSSISAAPAFKVDVLDTVGCGDSFTAAIAYGFLHNLPAVSTLTLANAVGAATATGCGAGRNVATRRQVLELLRLSNLNEDDKIWKALLQDHLDSEETSLLSRVVINGNDDKYTCISSAKVISELVRKLEAIGTRSMSQLEC